MEKGFRTAPRTLIAAILMLAAVLVLARPVCELWHAGAVVHGGAGVASMSTAGAVLDAAVKTSEPDPLCCTANAGGGMSQAAEEAAFGKSSEAPALPAMLFAMAFLAVAFLARPAVAFRRRAPCAAKSYCQRSSRILR